MALPVFDPLGHIRALKHIECGKDAGKHFLFDQGYTNLNSGSYGSHPREVHDVFLYYRARTEARPDAFVRYEYRTNLLDISRRAVAEYMRIPLETCVLSTNATTAFDTILRALVFERGDVIICFDTIYGSFGNTLKYISETTPAELVKIGYKLPLPDDTLLDLFRRAVVEIKAQGKRPRIACFDTVNTLPASRMPFESLTKICKYHNILSCIDGAHGIGNFRFELGEFDPDFFTSNCHKWLHVPRPCAFLYVPIRNQHLIRSTLPTGFAFVPLAGGSSSANLSSGRNAFTENFASVGTLDDTPYLCIPAALEWRKKLTWNGEHGEDAIMSYTRELAYKGGRIVARVLQTEVMDNETRTLGECSMTNVRLPLSFQEHARGDVALAETIGQWIMKTMILEFETAVNVFFYSEHWYTRLAAQVYVTEDDFARAGAQLKEACDRVIKGGSWEHQVG